MAASVNKDFAIPWCMACQKELKWLSFDIYGFTKRYAQAHKDNVGVMTLDLHVTDPNWNLQHHIWSLEHYLGSFLSTALGIALVYFWLV